MSEEREEELASIQAIFPELILSATQDFAATLDITVQPAEPLSLKFADSTQDVSLRYLPPLKLHLQLPATYPDSSPPEISLSSQYGWLPIDTLLDLQDAVTTLWEEYGRCQILFAYIDHIQQYVDQLSSHIKALVLPSDLRSPLQDFDKDTKLSIFNAGTYDCGICLEPKKGRSCHQLERCGHIFCKQCFLDFYNNAITEGDVMVVRCLNPDCTKGSKGKKKLLHPRELLAIGLEEAMVRRYVEMKRKKRMESDKTTVYCPRPWCQKPARSTKYPPIPADLLEYPDMSDVEETEVSTNEPKVHAAVPTSSGDDERLAICEGCKLAFCRTCFSTWHGTYKRCYPRDAGELTAEEKASYDYINANTSPCPTCSVAISKQMGCNHMQCMQCQTHFCYLCSAWLAPGNPYQHFNTPGTGCYQRLWELEEGDDGQGPEDGRGFAGARGAEALARIVAEEADRVEAEEAARALQDAEANVAIAGVPARVEAAPPVDGAAMVHVLAGELAQDVAEHEQHPLRRRPQRNPFPARPGAQGPAQAVRAHERQRQARAPAPRRPLGPADEENARLEEQMRRFVEMAIRDEEDGWDSDELAEHDADFRIH